MNALFSSKSHDWGTPQELFDKLNKEFNFQLDVCADRSNAKCDRFFDKEIDGLAQKWDGVCWMNPPYGREIAPWIRKAYESAGCGGTVVVCLVPARTDTRWWHEFIIFHEVRFIKGRLRFGVNRGRAPFPSAIVVMR